MCLYASHGGAYPFSVDYDYADTQGYPFVSPHRPGEEGRTPVVVYCLHCQTFRCRRIAELLERKEETLRAFSPQVVNRQRKSNQLEDHVFDLFPGYVFLYVREALKDLLFFANIDGIIRILGDENKMSGLQGQDADFARNLLEKDGIIRKITALKEGGTIRIRDPLFENHPCVVERIDYRKQRAKIRFQFDGKEWGAWVSCDIINEDG